MAFCLVYLDRLERILMGSVICLHQYVFGSGACILGGIADVVSLD